MFYSISVDQVVADYRKSDVSKAFASTGGLITNNTDICNGTTHTEMQSYWFLLNI